ncbi:gliding motility-associated C-terminal domain-containing protein [Myroides odoratimimus]|uniref:gliding motility-associated C-terminal domain-containing protein n=1 Tax=Myroides odoratimimus TaxID=76832 RepID=UPI0025823C88|nr:gliding motility-associated C-terminal domain-containing protein [Myroides odoratimimus]MDM1529087.1 gliding motility-associated C-terminal domain-containing protein [Myroides odoratimimus]
MKKTIYTGLFAMLLPTVGVAQTVNEGILTVLPGTEVSTLYSFSNEEEGMVKNDGDFYFYSHFNNEGIYTFDDKQKSSYAVFQPYEGVGEAQHLSGKAPSEFYDVLFNNPSGARAFELKNDMSVAGTANFHDGVVQVDSLEGAMVFQKGAKSINVSDKSHADGEVEKIGNEVFTYPIGDAEMYRFARISAPKTLKDSFLGKYYFKNSDRDQPHASKAGVIELIDNKEYWTILRENDTKSDIILTLSWDVRTTPSELLKNVEELRVVRWDDVQKLWVDEGGIVDADAKTVTTPTTVDGYGIFTLGTVKQHLILDGDIVIYNLVSPDGDGKNDYFIIDNINRFPNNTVEIYNRWGVKVYDTKSYDSAGNVFRGYSDGRVTVNKGEKLPTGTYFYIVSYEYKDASGSRMIKKSGYLHLESNK